MWSIDSIGLVDPLLPCCMNFYIIRKGGCLPVAVLALRPMGFAPAQRLDLEINQLLLLNLQRYHKMNPGYEKNPGGNDC